MSIASTKPLIRIACLLLCSLTVAAQGTLRRQIPRSDETRILLSVKNVIKALEGEYEFFLTEVIDQRKIRMNKLLLPESAERMFLHQEVIVENDFVDVAIENLDLRERDKKVEEYFENLAEKFGQDKDGEGPNVGKKVMLNISKISRIQATSPRDSLYVQVRFEIFFEGGKARNNYAFKKATRIAEIQVEKQGKAWISLIRSIYYDSPNRRLDENQNAVVILDEVLSNEVKVEDALLRDPIIISRNPILKAFQIDGLWGLLIDDLERKILVQPTYCEIGNFGDESLALVCRDGSWGFINKDGQEVIECQYDAAEDFRKGKARVQVGPKTFLIDTKGTVLR